MPPLTEKMRMIWLCPEPTGVRPHRKRVTLRRLTPSPVKPNQQKPLQQVGGAENTHFSRRGMILVQRRQKPRGDEAANAPCCDTASKCWNKNLFAIHLQRCATAHLSSGVDGREETVICDLPGGESSPSVRGHALVLYSSMFFFNVKLLRPFRD